MCTLEHAWQPLVGETVEVRHKGKSLGLRRMESSTEDSVVAWVEAEGVNTRSLIDVTDGYELWIPCRIPLACVQRLGG